VSEPSESEEDSEEDGEEEEDRDVARDRRCRGGQGEGVRLWRGGINSGGGLPATTVADDSDESDDMAPRRGLRLITEPEPGSSANWGRFAMEDECWLSESGLDGTTGIECCLETGAAKRGGSGIE